MLTSKKQHYSRKREAVLGVIRSTKSHPTAEWIYLHLKPLYPDLSLGTIYRNILEFKKNGDIVTISNVNGQNRYDANTKPHTHFICSECFSVVDIDFYFDDCNINEEIGEKYNLEISHHSIILYGKCRNCFKKM